MDKLKRFNIALVIGEAGLGKTSSINKICYDEKKKGNIVIKLLYSYEVPPSRLVRDLFDEVTKLVKKYVKCVKDRSEANLSELLKQILRDKLGLQIALNDVRKLVDFLWKLLSISIKRIENAKVTDDIKNHRLMYLADDNMQNSKVTIYDIAELLGWVSENIRDKRVYVVIDDLRFITKDDRNRLFDLIFNITPALNLSKVKFLLGWRITFNKLKEEAAEFVERSLYVELGELSLENIIEMARYFGLSISENVRRKIRELTLGRPSLCVVLFTTLKRMGLTTINEQVIRKIPKTIKELYDVYLRQYDPWLWALESLALVGEYPDQLGALNYIAKNIFLKEESDIFKALEKLASNVIRKRQDRYVFNHETIREHLHKKSMIISRGKKAHKLLANYYKNLCDKMTKHGIEPSAEYVEAIAYHSSQGVTSKADIELMELDLWACSWLARYYFKRGNPFRCFKYAKRMYNKARDLRRVSKMAESLFYMLRFARTAMFISLDEARKGIKNIRREISEYTKNGHVDHDLFFYYYLSEFRYLMYLMHITDSDQMDIVRAEMEIALKNMRNIVNYALKSLMEIEDKVRWLELKLKLLMAEFMLNYAQREITAAENIAKKWYDVLQEEGELLRKTSERIYLKALADFYNAMGTLCLMKSDFENAIRYFNKATECYEEIGFIYDAGISLRRKIVAILNKEFSEQELLESLNLVIKIIDIAKRTSHYRGVISRIRLKSIIDLALYRTDLAIEEARKALQMVKRFKDPLYTAFNELNYAFILLVKHKDNIYEMKKLQGIFDKIRGIFQGHDSPQQFTPLILNAICSYLLGESRLNTLLKELKTIRENISQKRFFLAEKALDSLIGAILKRRAVDDYVLRRVAIKLLTLGLTRAGP